MKTTKPATFVTVLEAPSEVEAQLVRARLDLAGFHAVVRNEFSAVTLLGSQSSGLARLFVQVPAAEAGDAKEFLAAPGESAE